MVEIGVGRTIAVKPDNLRKCTIGGEMEKTGEGKGNEERGEGKREKERPGEREREEGAPRQGEERKGGDKRYQKGLKVTLQGMNKKELEGKRGVSGGGTRYKVRLTEGALVAVLGGKLKEWKDQSAEPVEEIPEMLVGAGLEDQLGLARGATWAEIKASYKKTALKWHPDKNLFNVERSQRLFKALQQNYDRREEQEQREEERRKRLEERRGKNNQFSSTYFAPAESRGEGEGGGEQGKPNQRQEEGESERKSWWTGSWWRGYGPKEETTSAPPPPPDTPEPAEGGRNQTQESRGRAQGEGNRGGTGGQGKGQANQAQLPCSMEEAFPRALPERMEWQVQSIID